jgi:hypothetical protein
MFTNNCLLLSKSLLSNAEGAARFCFTYGCIALLYFKNWSTHGLSRLQAERDGLSKRLTTANKQLCEATSKADTASKEQQRLQAEVDRLSSIVHSHSVRLQK